MYPSGAAEATACAPRFPEAPVRFSMIICWPHSSLRCGLAIRITTSGEVAAGNGTTTRTKRPG